MLLCLFFLRFFTSLLLRFLRLLPIGASSLVALASVLRSRVFARCASAFRSANRSASARLFALRTEAEEAKEAEAPKSRSTKPKRGEDARSKKRKRNQRAFASAPPKLELKKLTQSK
uniref:Uncharacterized protein n=1 Tax=Pediastrum duplex TaxID=3105 RepID=A0A2U8GJ86_PEDDU|nr:hypothetical protein [Pediastrum duplex]